MLNIELRAAMEDDQDFLFESYKSTLKPYVDWAWGWDESFQRESFTKHFPVTQFQVITVKGGDAGGLYVEEQESLHFIRLIYLLPEFQENGFGRQLIENELARAHAAKKALHIKVVKINRAKSLYDRLGFKLIEETDVTYHMHIPV